MNIELIGNYESDNFVSMDLYADSLYNQLCNLGIQTKLIRPQPYFGRLLSFSPKLQKYFGYLDKFCVFPIILVLRRVKNWKTPTVYHICDHSNSYFLHFLPREKTIITVHDLIAIRSAQNYFEDIRLGLSGKMLQRIILNGLKKAKHVTFVSQKSYEDFSSIVSSELTSHRIIYNAFLENDSISEKDEVFELGEVVKGKPFFLHVGSGAWYKNRSGVLDIFRELKSKWGEDIALVFVGPRFDYDAQDLNKENIIFLSELSRSDLLKVYSESLALIFPSIIEGFGWPILEAISQNCPVVTTNEKPMTEIAGDSAIYIENITNRKGFEREWAREAAKKIATELPEKTRKDNSSIFQQFHPKQIYPQHVCYYQSIIEDEHE